MKISFKQFITEASKNDCHENENNPFKFTKDYYNGDFHQAIMDISYCWWENNIVGSREEMVEKMEKDFGYKFALLILLGGYNYQVGNGGHIQYWDNGYASTGSSGFGGNHKDLESHDMMIEWFKKSDLDKTTEGKKVLDIMETAGEVFEEMLNNTRCDECGGDGEIEENCYDCDGSGQMYDNCPECGGDGEIEIGEDEYEDCPECNGGGEIEEECEACGGEGVVYNTCDNCGGEGEENFSYQLDPLDDKYYSINNWEVILNDFAKKIIFDKFPDDAKDYDTYKDTKRFNI